uniref:Uncharacterized protein n=1 Tax=Daphnia magna TaxID=35525 RepID=A0A0P5UJV4_9CRUS
MIILLLGKSHTDCHEYQGQLHCATVSFGIKTICVAFSQQQYYHPRMIMGYPWMSPFAHQPMFDDYVQDRYPYMVDVNNVQARVKGYEPLPQDLMVGQPEIGENRFFFNSGSSSSIGNPLLKTVTFTITSTCTALSITTCVAMSNLSPNPVACAGRRRRFIEYSDGQSEDNGTQDDAEYHYPEYRDFDDPHTNIATQFPISASEVRIVMPTTGPSTGPARNSRDLSFGIASSMEDDGASNELVRVNTQIRGKRFFQQLWNGFATGVTSTTWSVVSSTFTSTLVVPGASTVLPCLPAGYGICQLAVGK